MLLLSVCVFLVKSRARWNLGDSLQTMHSLLFVPRAAMHPSGIAESLLQWTTGWLGDVHGSYPSFRI